MRLRWASSREPEFNAMLSRWIAARIWGEGQAFPGKILCFGVFDDAGELAASIGYHNWNPAAGVIEFSGAATTPRWLTRDVLFQMFEYPFEQLQCQMTFARIAPDNTRLLRILTAYGFEATRLPRMRGRDRDEILMTLTDDAWRSNGFHKGKSHG